MKGVRKVSDVPAGIGEFKLSAITASPIAVNFTAEGVPTASEDTNDMSEAVQITAAMRAFSDYFKVEADFGILICTTGIGMSICANKFKNVRAALVTNIESAHLTRQHNNSNVICMGAKFTPYEQAIEYVNAFINEKFEGGRHQRRVDQIEGE
jgi:RpiB/LacA/LacB family sugar-phosphate isomerase